MQNVPAILFLCFLGFMFPIGMAVAISKNDAALMFCFFATIGFAVGMIFGRWTAKVDQKRRRSGN